MLKGVRTGVSIALVGILAGGGGAYAASQITSAQIKDGTIQGKDIKRGTITAANLSSSAKKRLTGPAGPKGDKGDPGAAEINPVEVVDVVENNANDNSWVAAAVATCPDGQIALSGGYEHGVTSLGEVFANLRIDDFDDIEGSSWVVAGVNWAAEDTEDPEGYLLVSANCVPSPAASSAPYAERHASALRYAKQLVAKAVKTKRR